MSERLSPQLGFLEGVPGLALSPHRGVLHFYPMDFLFWLSIFLNVTLKILTPDFKRNSPKLSLFILQISNISFLSNTWILFSFMCDVGFNFYVFLKGLVIQTLSVNNPKCCNDSKSLAPHFPGLSMVRAPLWVRFAEDT